LVISINSGIYPEELFTDKKYCALKETCYPEELFTEKNIAR
jgi:hypothetical protein